jgi:hypothetical protein
VNQGIGVRVVNQVIGVRVVNQGIGVRVVNQGIGVRVVNQVIGVRVVNFNATFNNISLIPVNVIGGNRGTRRKLLTCCMLLTTLSHTVVSSTPGNEWHSNSQR